MTAQLLECTQPEGDNVHPIPERACITVPFAGLCKSAAPFWPHKNQMVRLQLFLMMTEVVPCILDKLLFGNSFVLKGRDLF